jgi:branched-chain amino acid transport system permease protein
MSPDASAPSLKRSDAPSTVLTPMAVLRWIWTPLILCALCAVIVVFLQGGSLEITQTLSDALINLILVIGLYIFIGNSGVFSFGHVSFMAIGAYTSALLTIPLTMKHILLPQLPHFLAVAHLGPLVAALISGVIAVGFALVAGTPLMRLSGLAAGIGTFSLLIIVNVVTGNWTTLTRGQQTMIGVPIDLTPGQALGWACVAIVVAYLFQESRVGLRLRASREDEVAARAVGIGVFRERMIAFALSAFFVGVAGALYAHYLGSFGASAFYLDITFLTFAMLVIGGVGSLSGAVVGSILVSVIVECLTRLQNGSHVGPAFIKIPDGSEQIVLSLFLLGVLILRPKGLLGGREIGFPAAIGRRFGKARAGAVTSPSSPAESSAVAGTESDDRGDSGQDASDA